MKQKKQEFSVKPIHPFPARMAPSIVWNELPCSSRSRRLVVLDPMAGSGTTLAAARMRGHQAIGFDTDPLARLISRAWCQDVGSVDLEKEAEGLIAKAKKVAERLSLENAYPSHVSDETRKFIKFWFDAQNRKQLTALARVISEHKNLETRSILWCAFSRMIITKKVGVSLGMDISHSRPHKTYSKAPISAFDFFPRTIRTVKQNMPFSGLNKKKPAVQVKKGDARQLPLADNSVDVVITSPPYFNAIDYMRGHKLSLVWMGYNLDELRGIRSANIGAEKISQIDSDVFESVLSHMGANKETSDRTKGMLRRYISDMDRAIGEIKRVLNKNGKAVFVIGDCSLRGKFILNSSMIKRLGLKHGLKIRSSKKRLLPTNRRYLPPPTSQTAGKELSARMREEIIITFSNS